MILRRPSAAGPKSARRVRVGGERRVSLARQHDVGTRNTEKHPARLSRRLSEKRGWGEGKVSSEARLLKKLEVDLREGGWLS